MKRKSKFRFLFADKLPASTGVAFLLSIALGMVVPCFALQTTEKSTPPTSSQKGGLPVSPKPSTDVKTTSERKSESNSSKDSDTKKSEGTTPSKDKKKIEGKKGLGSLPNGSVPDAKGAGGEPDGIVQVANLVYAGTKSSRCFADHFLIKAEKETAISTSRRFHAVKLADDDLFDYPLVIMTGEGDFQLTDKERENLHRYVERGGFLLASAGCSSTEWDRAFRREMTKVFPEQSLHSIEMNHPIFHTVYDIEKLATTHGGSPHALVGVTMGGRLGVIYSPDGLNDTSHTQGCCCCGGNELAHAVDINVNILAYALLY